MATEDISLEELEAALAGDALQLEALLTRLVNSPQAENIFERIKKAHPLAYEQEILQKVLANKGALIEAQGYEAWLMKLGVKTFTRRFAPIHHQFWQWNWAILQKVRRGETLSSKELVAFLPWSRELGKSSTVEWAAIAEGAFLRSGYILYVSSRQSQAEEHVTAIRDRIESEHVAETYPWLAKPLVGAHGNKFGWARDFLMTDGGWAVRPVGLDVAIRGGKTLNMRPTLLIADDIDELGDSPAVVENKERALTRSILPMGTDQTRVLVAQNPIHENSCVNRMLNGVSLALAVRTVFGPVPAMESFAYEVRQTEDGPRAEITQGTTTWPEVTVSMWQSTLDRVGPNSFLAEYQHDMSIALEERVLPEYDDRNLRLHVITWGQFEAKYGHVRIPAEWPCDAGLDIGYTAGHKSAWTFLTKAPQGAPLAGSIFRYRGCVFTSTTIGDMHVAVRARMYPDEVIEREFMSHEKAGERLVLNGEHGWHFHPCDSAKTAGIAQWRHYLRPDKTQAHPFHRDEKEKNGLWKIGRPAWFDIVDSDQFHSPRDDRGLKVHRDQAWNWRMRPVKFTDQGVTVEQPVKANEDSCDATRMLTVAFGPIEQGMTQEQKLQAMIPQGYHKDELQQRADLSPAQRQMTEEFARWRAQRMMTLQKPKETDSWGQPLT